MRRVYVAGAYSADNVVATLDNIRRGIRLATQVLLAGYAPFCPWLDYHFQLALRDGETLAVINYYDYSMAWLEVSDAVIVVPEGLEQSEGTLRELIRARELGLPVFSSMEELKAWGMNYDITFEVIPLEGRLPMHIFPRLDEGGV